MGVGFSAVVVDRGATDTVDVAGIAKMDATVGDTSLTPAPGVSVFEGVSDAHADAAASASSIAKLEIRFTLHLFVLPDTRQLSGIKS